MKSIFQAYPHQLKSAANGHRPMLLCLSALVSILHARVSPLNTGVLLTATLLGKGRDFRVPMEVQGRANPTEWLTKLTGRCQLHTHK